MKFQYLYQVFCVFSNWGHTTPKEIATCRFCLQQHPNTLTRVTSSTITPYRQKRKNAPAVAFIEKRQFCCFKDMWEPEKLLRVTPSHQSKDWEEKLKAWCRMHDNKHLTPLTAVENLSHTAAQVLQVGFSKGTNSAQKGSDLTSGCLPISFIFLSPPQLAPQHSVNSSGSGKTDQIQESSAENTRGKSILNLCSFNFTQKPPVCKLKGT